MTQQVYFASHLHEYRGQHKPAFSSELGVQVSGEGTAAHIWQLLMAGQMPVLAFSAVKWLPRAPRQTLYVLALQTSAALAAMATVFLLHL